MADYYTQFSFAFTVNAEAAAVIKQGLTYFSTDEDERDESSFSPVWVGVFANLEGKIIVGGTPTPEDWADSVSGETHTGCNFDFTPDEAGETFRVWADSNGSVDLVAEIISAGLEAGNDPSTITFEYAFTCSKPQLDSFGGGACAITKRAVLTRGTNEVAKQLETDIINM